MIKGLADRNLACIIALLVVLSLLLVHVPVNGSSSSGTHSPSQNDATYSLSPVPSLGGITSFNNSTYKGNMAVDLIFNFSNQVELTTLLNNLSNPASNQYGHFLTASQFNSRFAPSKSTYSSAISYFSQYGVRAKETFSNRLLLSLSGSATNFSLAFHTTIAGFSSGPVPFFAPSSAPMLPQWLSASVNTVIGLNSQYSDASLSLNLAGMQKFSYSGSNGSATSAASGHYIYPKVQTTNGIQFFTGAQFQPAYNETPLLSKILPRNEVIATLLWGGQYTSGGNTIYTGAYNPSDVSAYLSSTLPSGEPLPHIYGVPVGGAVAPGTSAQNDTSGAVVENTLDLEMAGSLAPGASIYNVYGQNSTLSDVTLAFETILSPPSQDPGLGNVSVISNSWGSNDTVISQWNLLLEECQARGITVLASSGDSGNDYSSSKSVSNTEYVQFPSTTAYNSFGVVAVGGTNISVNNNQASPDFLSITSQQAWYEQGAQFTSNTLGTVGGISSLYTEPIWQLDSQANSVIRGAGRGVPDVAAVANNTIIYFSNTTESNYYVVSGTSVSSPVLAGIIAEMNAYRATENLGKLGFLDPSIYFLGTQQYGGNLKAPYLTPFYDVTQGHNRVYSALPGYDLVTGMGSIDAFNFVTDLSQKAYNVSFRETGLAQHTYWLIQVNGIQYNSSSSYLNITLINGTYSFQVLNVLNKVSVPTGGHLTVSGSSVNQNLTFVAGFKVSFTENSLPANHPWYITSWNYTQPTFYNTISMLFPNGTFSYTVKSGDPNYYGSSGTFSVNGNGLTVAVNFTRGIFNVTFREAGLPVGQKWSVTTDNLTEYSTTSALKFTLPGGEYAFSIPASGAYIGNLTTLTMNTEGMNKTFDINFGYGYYVTFNLTGLPSSLHWNLLIATYNMSSTNNTIVVELQNGTYNYFGYFQSGTTTNTFTGNVTVNGSNVTVILQASVQPLDITYYAFYAALFIVGFAVLGIGLLLLRKK